MESLLKSTTAQGFTPVQIGIKTLQIRTLVVNWTKVATSLVKERSISRTYTIKSSYLIDEKLAFGEIAIVQLLRLDGWNAFWVDTFHKKFWNTMPDEGKPKQLPSAIRERYDLIKIKNDSKPNGCFDVAAERSGRVIWLEFKSDKDKNNINEGNWINSAMKADIRETDLFFVGTKPRKNTVINLLDTNGDCHFLNK